MIRPKQPILPQGLLMGMALYRLFIIAAAVSLTVACQPPVDPGGTEGAPREESYEFLLIIYTSAGNPFWTKVRAGAEEIAAALGCKVNFQYADNDPIKQNDLMEVAIANRVDGLAINISLDDAYDEAVQRALDAGIPVIGFNNDDSEGAAGNPRLAYIGQDERAAGHEVAKRLIKEGGLKAGDHVLCPVEYPESTYAINRYAGVSKAFGEIGISSEVLKTDAISLEDVLTRMTQYLLGHPETDAVLAMGETPMSVTPQAIEEANRELPSAGFDISRDIAENIRDGRIIAAVDQKPFYQGSLTVMQLYYYNKYNLLPCDVDTGGGLVDKSNVAKVLELADTIR